MNYRPKRHNCLRADCLMDETCYEDFIKKNDELSLGDEIGTYFLMGFVGIVSTGIGAPFFGIPILTLMIFLIVARLVTSLNK